MAGLLIAGGVGMTDSKDVKDQLAGLWKKTKEQAAEVAEEVKRSAIQIRDKLEEQEFRREQRRLFEELGEQSYSIYKHHVEGIPEKLQATIKKLDDLAARAVSPEDAQKTERPEEDEGEG